MLNLEWAGGCYYLLYHDDFFFRLKLSLCGSPGLPSSLSELHLDGNKITKVQAENLKGLKNLAK